MDASAPGVTVRIARPSPVAHGSGSTAPSTVHPRSSPISTAPLRTFAVRAVPLIVATAASMSTVAAPAATPPPATGSQGAVVFVREQQNPDGTVGASSLWTASPSGAAPTMLTASRTGVRDGGASWSPDGTRLVFERIVGTRPGSERQGILLLTPGQRPRRLTHGTGRFTSPAWGPGNRIAFVARYRDRECVVVVEGDGRAKRDLFCPEAPVQLTRAVWSGDGTRLFVSGGYYAGRLEPTWRSLAWRVDAATGSSVELDDRILDEPLQLEFSPDGRRGIYSGTWSSEMTLVDFGTRSERAIGYGYAPRWSGDGRRIAFTGEVYEAGAEFRYYEPLFVVNADGSQLRQVTTDRTNNHAYTAADWSKDNLRVLANRRTYLDPALTLTRFSMRVVNTATGRESDVAEGRADAGAWFEPRTAGP